MKKSIKVLNKLLIILMIVSILNNFFVFPIANAENVVTDDTTLEDKPIKEQGQGFFLSFLGLLTLPTRALVLGLGYGINSLAAAVAYIEGATDVEVDTTTITPFDIFFNKVKILDINFFEIGSDVNIVNTIRTGIASWYYALRLVAMSILLVLLIYIGIRMAISTIASEKARYQKMLIDWVVSLVLIFLINYIIVFVITLNNNIVSAIEKGVKTESVSQTYESIRNLGFNWKDIDSIPATVIYCMLVVQVFGLMITYFNRMLKVAFLIIISPLITLTYAVDRMGDGKAQAFGNWMKEFIFTVITQIFHCIIYMSMINVAFELLIEHSGKGVRHALAAAVMAFLCVNFTRTAENLVRKILMRNHTDNSISFAGGTAAAAVALQKSKSLGTATRKAVNVTKQNLRDAGNALKTTSKFVGKAAAVPIKGAGKLVALPIKGVGKIRNEVSWGKEVRANGYGDLKKNNREEYKRKKGAHIEDLRENRKQKRKNLANSVKNAPGVKQVVGAAGFVGKGVKGTANLAVKGARGTANFKHKLNRIASQSDIYQITSGVLKAQTAVAVGTLTGSMMYGATGNAGQAFAMGIAGMNMHKGFQKSALTMESRTQSSLIGAGAKSKEDAFAINHEVASNPYLYDGKSPESLKQAENLLRAIGKQLETTIGNPEYKTKIRNEIDRAAQSAPEMTPQAISRAFDKIADDMAAKKNPDNMYQRALLANEIKKDLSSNAELQKACDEYARFSNMKQIHAQMEAGQAMGISKDAYVQECVQGFVPLGTSTPMERSEIVRTLEHNTDEEIQTSVNGMSEDQFGAIVEEVGNQRRDLEAQITEASEEQLREIEAELKNIERIESTMASRILSEKSRIEDESKRELLRRVGKQCNEEIDSLLQEISIINSSTATGGYKKPMLREANISESEFRDDSELDRIVTEREKRLNDVKSETRTSRKNVSQLERQVNTAKAVRQIKQLETRRSEISKKLKIT